MKTFYITYDTEYGEAYYEGEEGQSFQSFIKDATKVGIDMGLIEQGSCVLDHDNEISES